LQTFFPFFSLFFTTGGDTAARQDLPDHPARREQPGRAAQQRARDQFSAEAIVPQYEALYRRVCAGRP